MVIYFQSTLIKLTKCNFESFFSYTSFPGCTVLFLSCSSLWCLFMLFLQCPFSRLSLLSPYTLLFISPLHCVLLLSLCFVSPFSLLLPKSVSFELSHSSLHLPFPLAQRVWKYYKVSNSQTTKPAFWANTDMKGEDGEVLLEAIFNWETQRLSPRGAGVPAEVLEFLLRCCF